MQDVPPPPYVSPPGSPYPPRVNYQQKARAEGHITLKYGLIAGAIMAAITILMFIIILIPGVNDALYRMFPQTVPGIYFSLASTIISLFVALLNMIVYFCMGLFVSRRTGKIGTAMIACLWALLCFLLADICTTIISFFIYVPVMPGQAIFLTFIDYGLSFIIDLFLALILGFSAGALGALIGMPRANGSMPGQ